MAQTVLLLLSAEDRAGLQRIIEDRRRPVEHIQRSEIVLLSADRLPVLEIAKRVGVNRPTVWCWQQRYAPLGTITRVVCGSPPFLATHVTRSGRACTSIRPKPRSTPHRRASA